VTVSITDNGVGIPAAAREKVFAMFHRETTRERYHGTGVGLTTCRRIIERHHGRIWVQPHDQPGTTISFTVPTAPTVQEQR
jgi:signal transduction histidine kinase